MALTDGNGSEMVMPVAPMYGGGGQGGFGFGDGNGWWILLLFILLGWGGNGYGNGGYCNMGGNLGGTLYPWMNQTETINDGFRDQMLNTNITSIRDGINDISTQLCNGFAGVNAGIANGFAQSEISANARQMANMQQAFANQTAMTQGFNALGTQFADCLKKIIKKAKDNLVFTKYTVGSCVA